MRKYGVSRFLVKSERVIRRLSAGVLIVMLFGVGALAQENDYDYTVEKIWGINKNTASGLIGGFTFRYSKAIRPKYFKTYGVELMNVRHPAEARVVARTGNSFIIGKVNNFYTIRLQYGRTLTIFKK